MSLCRTRSAAFRPRPSTASPTPATPEVERLLTATNGDSAANEGAAPAVLPARGEPAERLALPSEPRALHEAVIARGWSDGLPIIPPTPALVEALSRLRRP